MLPHVLTGCQVAFGGAALAQFLTVDPGEERTGVNVRTTLAHAVRVDGVSIGPNGQPLQNVLVGIANASAGSL